MVCLHFLAHSPQQFDVRDATGFVGIAAQSWGTTAADGLTAAIIILAMSFGLIVPKMVVDYFSDRFAQPKS